MSCVENLGYCPLASTVLFMPATPCSELASRIRKKALENNQGRDWTIKVVEMSGKSLTSCLQKSNPSPKAPCTDASCMSCPQGILGICSKEGCVYKISCTHPLCGEGGERYWGESSRTLSIRQGEHQRSLEKEKQESVLWTHCAQHHDGEKQHFKMELVSEHRDPLSRLVKEGVMINRDTTTKRMNNKSNFHQPKVTRTIRVRGLGDIVQGGGGATQPSRSSTQPNNSSAKGSSSNNSSSNSTGEPGPTQGPVLRTRKGRPPANPSSRPSAEPGQHRQQQMSQHNNTEYHDWEWKPACCQQPDSTPAHEIKTEEAPRTTPWGPPNTLIHTAALQSSFVIIVSVTFNPVRQIVVCSICYLVWKPKCCLLVDQVLDKGPGFCSWDYLLSSLQPQYLDRDPSKGSGFPTALPTQTL